MAKKNSNFGLGIGAGAFMTIAVMTIAAYLSPQTLASIADTFADNRYSVLEMVETSSDDADVTEKEEKKPAITTTSLDVGSPEVTTQANPDTSKPVLNDGIIRSENEDLYGRLENKKLTIEFKKYKSLINLDKGEQHFFASSSEANSRIKQTAETSGYTIEQVTDAVRTAIITTYLQDAPEVKSFTINGNTVTIQFKKAPTSDFSFLGSQALGWEGLYFEVALPEGANA